MTQTPSVPADPDAPAEHKLPSGITVTLRSHRTLRRPDIQAVWRSVTDPELFGPQQHDALVMLLVIACSDERFAAPLTSETLDLFDGDDYIALYGLVNDAYRLVNGLSVIPRGGDGYQDPKAPTTESNDSVPDSRETPSSTSPETTGMTSTTTAGSPPTTDGPQP